MVFKSKQIVEHFFEKTASKEFRCRCGKTVKQDTSHGYVNLVNHLSRCTPDYEQQMSRSNSRLPFTSSVSKKAKRNIYSYLNWIITDGLPFNFVESECTKKYSNLENISRQSIVKHLARVLQVRVPQAAQSSASFAETILQSKRQKLDEGEFGTLKWIKPTSNIAERFFSKVRNVYTDNRKRLLPMNIESQMFLQANRQLWTPEDVQQFL